MKFVFYCLMLVLCALSCPDYLSLILRKFCENIKKLPRLFFQWCITGQRAPVGAERNIYVLGQILLTMNSSSRA